MATPAGGRRAARPAVRARPVHPDPRHARRDDRQQRVRAARGRLRAHRRQRARARRRRRHGPRFDGAPARRAGRRCPGLDELVARATSRSCAPSSAGSAGRSPATRWSTCCPRTGADLAKALVGTEGTRRDACSAATVRAGADRRGAGARRARLPGHADGRRRRARAARARARWRSRASTPGWSTWCAGPRAAACRRCPPGAAGCMVEVGGATQDEALERARALAARRRHRRGAHPAGRPEAAAMWRIRADGAGLAGRTAAGRAGLAGLGGRRGAAGAAGRVPARVRGADGALRRRRAWPYGHFGDGCVHLRIDIRWSASGIRAARVHDRRRDAGRLARRLAVRGARRRSGPLRAAAVCTRRGRSTLFGAVQGPVRPATTCSTPACWSDPRPLDADLRRPRAPPAAGRRARLRLRARRRRPHHRRAPLRRRRQVPGRQPRAGGFMCPSLPGDEGREGRRPAGGPACCRSWRTATLGRRRAGRRPRCTSRWTCACPARRARRTAPRASTWRSTSPRCCTVRYRGKLRPVVALRPRLAAALGAADHRCPGLAALTNARPRHPAVAKAVLAGGGMDTRRRW